MKKVTLGATGSFASSLAKKLVESGEQVHLVGRDNASLSELANELNSSFTSCDVLEENFSEKIVNDLKDDQVNGLAYCVGSIDLKPLKLTKKSDFMQSFNLNLVSATEIIKSLADNLKTNKGSIVLFSTVAVKQGFPNHAIVSSAKGAVITLSELLAEEYKEKQITFNVLALGAVQTEMLEEAFPGYIAPISATEMAKYIFNFALTGNKVYNGKVLQVSSTNP